MSMQQENRVAIVSESWKHRWDSVGNKPRSACLPGPLQEVWALRYLELLEQIFLHLDT